MTMLRRIIPLVLLGLLAFAVPASAYLTTSGTGSVTAAVGSLTAPVVSVPTTSGPSVSVSFTAGHVVPASATRDAQITYVVERSADGGASWAPTAGTCGGGLSAPATSCSDTVAVAGTYVYRVTARFRSWTAAGVSGSVVVALLSAPSITSRPSSPSANTAPSLAFSGGGSSSYECSIDGAAFSVCSSPITYSALAAGSHTFKVHAVQGVTIGPDATYTWTIATIAPTIGSKPSSSSANAAAATIAFSHATYSSFQCKLDAGTYASCASPVALRTLNGNADLAAGSHSFSVRAVDADGAATSAASYTWTVNATAPVIASGPPNPSASTAASFVFSHSAYVTLQCQLDGGGFSSCTSPKTYTGLAAGSHTFQVRAVDADGVLTAVASSSWTINTTAPTITAQPANPSTATTATFSFTQPAYTSFACKLDGAAFVACNSRTITYAGPLSLGSHTFTVHALDGASVATADATYTWTVVAAPTLTLACTPGSGKREAFNGTTSINSGTVTVKVYAGIGTGGTLVETVTTTTFSGAGPYTWTTTTANDPTRTGQTFTAAATQVSASGGTSNTPTCQFIWP